MSPRRLLNYASLPRPLHSNARHLFAANHALEVYAANAIYSFIPKNACSTMRYSIALANQCIAREEEIGWIHANNATFRASLRSLVTAEYTFVILRCPFSRLASCFLDKLVDSTRVGKIYQGAADRDSLDVTFEVFVRDLKTKSHLLGNEHWRPQVDFLVYKEYDDYFCIEDFPSAKTTIMDRVGLCIHDARHLTAHGGDRFKRLGNPSEYARASVRELRALKRSGMLPSIYGLYSERAIEDVARLFAQDIVVYKERCGRAPTFDLAKVPGSRFWGLGRPQAKKSNPN